MFVLLDIILTTLAWALSPRPTLPKKADDVKLIPCGIDPETGIHRIHAGRVEVFHWILSRQCPVLPHTNPKLHDFRLLQLPNGTKIVTHERNIPEGYDYA